MDETEAMDDADVIADVIEGMDVIDVMGRGAMEIIERFDEFDFFLFFKDFEKLEKKIPIAFDFHHVFLADLKFGLI